MVPLQFTRLRASPNSVGFLLTQLRAARGQLAVLAKTSLVALRIGVKSLTAGNGGYRLLLDVANQNTKKPIWAAISAESFVTLRGSLTDPSGNEIGANYENVAGIVCSDTRENFNGTLRGTEIQPKESLTVTVKFPAGRATSGKCQLQLVFLVLNSSGGRNAKFQEHNLVLDVEAK